MRTYINYCGKSDSGKSTTLGLVIKELKIHGTIIHIEKSKPKTGVVNYRVVFVINEQCVAISTHGDDLDHLLKNHRFFDKYSPKVMVTASHSHKMHDHNLYIDNYVFNEVTADNKSSPKRGHFNYHKIQSVPCSDEKEQKRIDDIHADYIYNLILESLKI